MLKLNLRPVFAPQNRNKLIFGVVITICLIALITMLLLLIKSSRDLAEAKDPYYASKLQEELPKSVVADMKKIIILPDGEPDVKVMVDVDLLKKENPEFFKNAQKGDILVIYPTVAYIFRSSAMLIVSVAPVVQQPTPTVAPK